MVVKRILLLLGCMACAQQGKFNEKCEDIKRIPVTHEVFNIIDTISIYKLVKNYELLNGNRNKNIPINEITKCGGQYIKFKNDRQVEVMCSNKTPYYKDNDVDKECYMYKNGKLILIHTFKHVNGIFTVYKVISRKGDSLIIRHIDSSKNDDYGFEYVYLKEKL